jgi:hypothetical protein
VVVAGTCYGSPMVDPSAIREFAQRFRAPVAEHKADYWEDSYRATPQDTVSLVQALFEHMREVSPEFPNAEYLANDFEHHIRQKEMLDRASSAIALR